MNSSYPVIHKTQVGVLLKIGWDILTCHLVLQLETIDPCVVDKIRFNLFFFSRTVTNCELLEPRCKLGRQENRSSFRCVVIKDFDHTVTHVFIIVNKLDRGYWIGFAS
jgi:hypothetical protein